MRCPKCGEKMEGNLCLSCGYQSNSQNKYNSFNNEPPKNNKIKLKVKNPIQQESTNDDDVLSKYKGRGDSDLSNYEDILAEKIQNYNYIPPKRKSTTRPIKSQVSNDLNKLNVNMDENIDADSEFPPIIKFIIGILFVAVCFMVGFFGTVILALIFSSMHTSSDLLLFLKILSRKILWFCKFIFLIMIFYYMITHLELMKSILLKIESYF